jgi:hypothetical protein
MNFSEIAIKRKSEKKFFHHFGR